MIINKYKSDYFFFEVALFYFFFNEMIHHFNEMIHHIIMIYKGTQ
jgi:hypothetical protein